MADFVDVMRSASSLFRSFVKPRALAAEQFSIGSPSSTPIVESGSSINIGGDDSNSTFRTARTISSGASGAPTPGTYTNLPDLTNDYAYAINYAGFNVSLDSNTGRSGIFETRRRLVHAGQGDFVAYNASVRVVSSPPVGATHWLASPAGVLFNGTVIAEADGVYLNPFEIVMTDTPSPGVSYNVTGNGLVVNMIRNSPSGVSLGQVWHGLRPQNTGSASADTIASATGKFFSGFDTSMPSLDFGANKAAFVTKANDRFYPNALADELNDGTTFIRANHRATTGFDDYSVYDTVSGVARWKWVLNNAEAFNLSDTAVNAIFQLNANAGVFIANGFNLQINGQRVVSNRKTGWAVDTGTAKRTANATYSGTASGAYNQAEIQALMDALRDATQTIKALKDDFHQTAGHGLIGN